MVNIISDGLCFDDVLLVPQYSEINSRSEVDLSVKIKKGGFSTTLKHPIVPANMQSIIGLDMAANIINSGGLAILHRFIPIEEQYFITENILDEFGSKNFGVSVGVKETDKEAIKHFIDNGVKIFCVDVAHGDTKQCLEMTKWIAQNYPEIFLISGNVATGSAARRLWRAGADMVKCGVGPGSLCSTRIETGNGVPQLTALIDVAEAKESLQKESDRFLGIIADGGLKNAGDLVKSLCFADLVMTGNLFSGCPETPGDVLIINGVRYKEYVGSSTHKLAHIEGVSALVNCKDPYHIVLTKLLEGLRSGCSYQGAHNLEELRDSPTFIKITAAGLIESHPHDVQIIK